MHVADTDYWKAAAIEAAHSGVHWRIVCYAATQAQTAQDFDTYIQAAIHAAERLNRIARQ